jgi:hypothetical protein
VSVDLNRRHDHFVMAMRLTVPLCIAGLMRLQGETRDATMETWREHALDGLLIHGDNVGFKGPWTAGAFTQVARGVAVLAFSLGGVQAFGTSWCAQHHPQGRTDDLLPCDECLPDPATRPAPALHVPVDAATEVGP